MGYNFDEIIDRRNTSCVKWDILNEEFGRDDLIPMWVADMDFRVSEDISEAIIKRAQHNVYGYTDRPASYYEAIKYWIKSRHDWDIERDMIINAPGVVPSLAIAILSLTEPGDKIIIQSPVYHPFYSVIKGNGRVIVNNKLSLKNGKYEMVLEDLQNQIDDKVKMIILCNPHNPVGRVWSKEELKSLGEICTKNNIIILSDEIHSDIIYSGHKHVPIASISEELSMSTITCMAPSKTFNIAGLNTSYMIIKNLDLRNKIEMSMNAFGIAMGNVFGISALEAAYINGHQWLKELLIYLEGNVNFAIEFLKNVNGIYMLKPEGTYLGWLDCRELGMHGGNLKQFMINEAKVGISSGNIFGNEGEGFIRLNLGCPRKQLEESLNRIERAVKSRIG